VYVTEHVADAPVPANVHGFVVKVPVPLEVKLTVPAGVLAVPAAVSVTVAVHVPAWPTLNVVGQASVVVVVLRLTVTVALPLLVA
jgi:hypothetical protein